MAEKPLQQKIKTITKLIESGIKTEKDLLALNFDSAMQIKDTNNRNSAVKPVINLLIAILLPANVESCRLYVFCNRLIDVCKGAIRTFFFAQTVFLAQVYAERKIAPPDSFSAYRQSVRI